MKIKITTILLCLLGFHSIAQTITGIVPSSATAGSLLTAQVTGSGLFFMTASPPGIHSIQLSKESCNIIDGTNIQVVDDDHFNVDFDVPSDATNGIYDVAVKTELNPFFTHMLPASFTISGGMDRSLISVTPNSLAAGGTTSTVVQGTNIKNMVDSGGFVIKVSLGGEQYIGFNISSIDPDHINVDFAPVAWATNGMYDVYITSNKGCFNLSQGVQVTGGLPRSVTAITPSSGSAGNILTAQVTGQNLFFATASPPGVQQVKLFNSTCNEIEGTNFNVIDDDHVDVDFDIPITATNGLYDLLLTVMTGESYTLTGNFLVTGGIDRSINSMGPSPAPANTVYTAGIGGSGIQSMLDTTTVITIVGPNNFIITGNNFTVINPDSITVDFNIPPFAENGFYDLSIVSAIAGCYTLNQATEITGGVFRGITAIQPFEAYKGMSLTAQITGQFVYFTPGTSTSGGIYSINLHNTFNDDIQGSAISVVDTDHVNVDFTIPYSVHKGLYDVNVNTVGGTYTLPNGFEVKGTVISGGVYLDIDSNGIMDGQDYYLANRKVRLLPDSIISFTDANGIYHFAVDPGTYTIEFVPDTNWSVTTLPVTYSVTVNATDISGLDFGINPIIDEYNMLAVLTGMTPRCGMVREYTVTYTNRSTTTTKGLVSLQLDADLNYSSAAPPPDNINGSTLEWNYDSLLVNESKTIHVMVQMPVLPGTVLSSLLCVDAQEPVGNVVASNCDTLDQIVSCSYDPNDKSVEPEGEGALHYVLKNSDLDYLIRFQNTGNDTAYLVYIVDTIDASLDITSLQVIASSHPLETTISGRKAEFRFNNIMLPDSNVDELHSHGFVKYRIRPLIGLPEGTTVTNTGHIYFDFNSAVVTNEVVSTLVSTIGVPELESQSAGFIIYPDPVTDQSILEIRNVSFREFNMQIMDATGRIVSSHHVSGNSTVIRKNDLTEGIYFIFITDENTQSLMKGKFVIR
jgi:hypothetical protein